ncbi:CbtA family protein [Actinomadura scrupuli]|uniref:CbtA family protein n=1 Tax=Actinomadura scrupuli TaxID=559629 RepID=UPI003D95BAA9
MTMRTLLVRGMLAGLAAAVLALAFAWVFGEPQVEGGIAFEHHQAALAGAVHEHELLSRTAQKTAGLAVGVLVFGVALGGLYALAFAVAYGRIGRFSARATAALVAAGGFVAVELVPFLKYPANPPGANDPDTIGTRTTLYFAMITIAIVVSIAAVQTGRRLAPRLGNWNATLAAAGLFAVLVAVAYLVLPSVEETPAAFPAGVLWRFRLASLGIQTVLWTTLGLGFGALTQRALTPGREPVAAPT